MTSNSDKRQPEKKRRKIEYASKREIDIPASWPITPKLQVWDVNKNRFPDNFFVLLEGSRRSGKSNFMGYLLYHYQDAFDLVVVMTNTDMNNYWQPRVSNKFVHNGWKPDLVAIMLKKQRASILEQKKLEAYGVKDLKKADRILLILDDIVGDRRHIHEDTILNNLAVEGRHSNISVLLSTQEPRAIGTALRNNADVAIIFQQKGKRAKESVIEDFLMFKCENKMQAEDILKTYTKNHDCIIVEMSKLQPGIPSAYFHLPEEITFDKNTQKERVPKYQIGSKYQRALATTIEGSIPKS
jgi:hypothetical protein